MEQNELQKYLKPIYGRDKVMTIKELVQRMVVSEITVRIKLKKTGALTSYNKNGQYYTLPHIPVFDPYGLWNYKDIRFSKHGNMCQTIVQLVNESPYGLDAGEIKELIGYPAHSLLHQLCVKSLIKREKLQGKYLYFSMEEQLHQSRRDNDETLQERSGEGDLSCTTAVRLLIERIKRPKSDLSAFMYCADCSRVYPAEEFEKIVPPHSNAGYNVMILTGRLIFCERRILGEAVRELEKRNIPISTSEVAYLA